MMRLYFKYKIPFYWHVLTTRFDFWNLVLFTNKDRERFLSDMLELAYAKGREDQARVSLEIFNKHYP